MNTSVEAIASRMFDRFHIEMDIYQISENSMDGLNRMGMLSLSKKAVCGLAQNQMLRMPVDCYEVKAVIAPPSGFDAWFQRVKVTFQDIWFPPQLVFVPVPNTVDDPNQAVIQNLSMTPDMINKIEQMFGPYEEFQWEPPFVKINTNSKYLIVIYNRIPVDDDGLAEIPESAFNGCLYHCLYAYYEPLFLQGKIPQYVWNEVTKWRNTNFNQSRNKKMMERLSQNEMSKVHSIMSSFDRKRTRIAS